MKKQIKYNKYKHKETGKIIKACKFKYGYEDGREKINGQYKPYINGWDNGYKTQLFLTEKDYIVCIPKMNKKYHKKINYIFVFKKDIFEKFYTKVKE